VDLSLGQDSQGSLAFPIPPLQLNISGNMTRDFTVPALPQIVTISGTVKTAQGQPVADSLIFGTTSTVTNTPNVAFGSGTQTKSDGTYQLKALSGTGYLMTADSPTLTGPMVRKIDKLIERLGAEPLQ
jgi:hypothetical protein